MRNGSHAVLVAILLFVGGAAAVGASAPEEAPSATLNWQARQEGQIYGYLIYRSEKREGPFRRINRTIVPANAADADTVESYRFVDRDVEPGKTYYYYLDTLGGDGKKKRFSGVMSKTVAPRPEAGHSVRPALFWALYHAPSFRILEI